MSDVTRILESIEDGDPQAAEELLPLVYDELRNLAAAKMSQENPGHSLQATALVHEAYLRLVDVDHALNWDSRGHFFAAAAEAMRRILINHARDKARLKRGGDRRQMSFDDIQLAVNPDVEDVIELSDAIDRLAEQDERSAAILKLRCFAGLKMDEAAKVLGLSLRSAERYWEFARAWLYAALRPDDSRLG